MMLFPDYQGHAGLDVELFTDSHQHRAESIFMSFFPTSSSVTPKPNEFLCDLIL